MTQTEGQPPLPQRDNGLGVAGFVCGLLAAIFGIIPFVFFLSFALALGLLGEIFGGIGWRRVRQDPGRGGKGLSIAGLILGFLGIALALFWIWAIESIKNA